MGSKSSKVKRPAPVNTEAKAKPIIVPRVPQDVVDEILDHLAADSDLSGTLRPRATACLRACALVSKSWVQPCRRHLFHTVVFTPRSMKRWLKTFPIPGESPTRHIRNISLWTGDGGPIVEKFFEYASSWPEMESIAYLWLDGGLPPLRKRSFWRLPRSTNCLAIDIDTAIHAQIRYIKAQLPNLDELQLSWSFAAVEGGDLLRIDSRLLLYGEYVDDVVVDTVLEDPPELRFTEVCVYCPRERLPSAVGLAEACCMTLVKLSHTVLPHGKSHLTLVCEIQTLTPFPDATRWPREF